MEYAAHGTGWAVAMSASRGGSRHAHRVRVALGLARDLGQLVHLFGVEPGQLPEPTGQLHRAVVVLAAEPAEREQLVDDALELERTLAAVLVLLGQAPEPVAAHL